MSDGLMNIIGSPEAMTTRLIWTDEPSSWRDLQDKVCTLFQEMDCQAETEKSIKLARGSVNVDVYVRDAERNPASIYICECKQWSKSVPKSVVHAFRTVIADSGTQWFPNLEKGLSERSARSGTAQQRSPNNLGAISRNIL